MEPLKINEVYLCVAQGTADDDNDFLIWQINKSQRVFFPSTSVLWFCPQQMQPPYWSEPTRSREWPKEHVMLLVILYDEKNVSIMEAQFYAVVWYSVWC